MEILLKSVGLGINFCFFSKMEGRKDRNDSRVQNQLLEKLRKIKLESFNYQFACPVRINRGEMSQEISFFFRKYYSWLSDFMDKFNFEYENVRRLILFEKVVA